MTSQRADKKKGYRSRRKKDQATWHEHPHAPGYVRSCHSHNRQGLCCLGTTRIRWPTASGCEINASRVLQALVPHGGALMLVQGRMLGTRM